MYVCLSVRPGPETHIPKKTHTFLFQVSRNEGPVCLGTWGRGRAGRPGQGRGRGSLSEKGRAGQGVVFIYTCIYRQTKWW
jgi:hypothetical protein